MDKSFSFAVPIRAPEELRGAKARSMEIRCSAHFRGQFHNGLLFEVSGCFFFIHQTDKNINLYPERSLVTVMSLFAKD